MPLSPGTRFGALVIGAALGAGGMGEVYRARDTRLNRDGYPETDLHLITPLNYPRQGNLIALLPGTDASVKPLMLLAHLDVVEAKREDWSRDPFALVEEVATFTRPGLRVTKRWRRFLRIR